jgi:ribosomal protein L31E
MVEDGFWAMPQAARSAPLRAEPATPSQAKRAAAIASARTFLRQQGHTHRTIRVAEALNTPLWQNAIAGAQG